MRSLRSSKALVGTLVCLIGASLTLSASAETEVLEDAPEKSKLSSTKPVVCLRTERYPLEIAEKGTLQSRMMREISRQAVLLAAREELGLPTRDETLGEPFSNSGDSTIAPLEMKFRAYYDGLYKINLTIGADEEQGIEAREVWTHEGRLPTERLEIYLALAKQLTAEVPAIAEALSKAGFVEDPDSLTKEETQLPEIEDLLKEANFVSQFAAVRAAHRAIEGEELSPKRLGILVRGYTHLAALTPHLWSTHYEALAARALLYAERMRETSTGELLADWHQAYAMGLVGMHSTALILLDSLEKSKDPEKEAPDETTEPKVDAAPEWAQIIRPYCEFEHEQLRKIGEEDSDYKELVTFLLWEQFRAYQHGRWIYEKGIETMAVCPEAYSVYSVLANWNALRIKRVGASSAMEVFGSRLSARVARIDDLPDAVKQVSSGVGGGIWSKLFGGFDSVESTYSRRPINISQALVRHTDETAAETDLSWAVLGSLIAEEQFVQIANLMRVAGDGVERSNAELVSTVLPLVKGHRYEKYIRTFTVQKRGVKEEYWAILDGMKVVDPRGNMARMFSRLWSYHSTPEVDDGKRLSWTTVFKPTSTLAGCIESAYGKGTYWRERAKRSENRQISTYFRDVSPHSTNAFVLGMLYAEDVDMDKLASWETETGEDPIAWLSLGSMYYERWETEAAARCYKRSLEVSPCFAATEGLANSYFHGGKEELWAPTLETYLEYEDLGLAHGQIHSRLANYYMGKAQWTEALPHAEAAAQTWSAWGLLLAGRVHEGLQNWKESEYWVAEASRNYPSSSSGIEWYLWCRRTGMGDLDSASDLAKKWEALPRNLKDYKYYVATYFLLEDRPQEALKLHQELEHECNAAKKAFDKAWYLAHIATIAGTIEDEQLRTDTVKKLRQVAQGPLKKASEELLPIVIALCDLLQGETLDAKALDEINSSFAEVNTYHKCNYGYFIGAALEEQERFDEADAFLRQAAFNGPFNYVNSALAGHHLVLRHGPQRGGPFVEADNANEPVGKDDDSNASQDGNEP